MEVEGCRNCWTDCDKNLGPFPLSISKASLQGSLVLTDIAWDHSVTDASKQCLVTWEVSGGGLLGNMVTESSTVELSLWAKTVYQVEVTCKNKKTGGMRKSIKLIVDTSQLNEVSNSMEPVLGLDAVLKNFQGYFSTEVAASDASESAESRMKILKDSSKDFVSTYNPAATTTDDNDESGSDADDADDVDEDDSSEENDNAFGGQTETIDLSAVLRNRIQSQISMWKYNEFLTYSIIFAIVVALIVLITLVLVCCFFIKTRRSKGGDTDELISHEVTSVPTSNLHV
ncbi:hypothetical protein ACFFRR_002921 [Megaselia abdita]